MVVAYIKLVKFTRELTLYAVTSDNLILKISQMLD